MKIGIFDSGIGGLTVLKECVQKCPNHEYYYVGDTAHLPYGNKKKEQLYALSCRIIDFLLLKKIDLLIIACGTVSSNVYQELTSRYSIPIINVIFPTISYIVKKGYRQVGLIATEMTVESGLFQRQLEAKGILVVAIACPSFVPLIEEGKADTLDCASQVKNALEPFSYQPVDALILGDTHYPIIAEQIKGVMGDEVKIINIGTIVAELLIHQKESFYQVELYFSKLDEQTEKNIDKIIKTPYAIYPFV